jgi:hypothetical protein
MLRSPHTGFGTRFTAIKESIHFEGNQDLQTKVMVALFGLFAEVCPAG